MTRSEDRALEQQEGAREEAPRSAKIQQEHRKQDSLEVMEHCKGGHSPVQPSRADRNKSPTP